ncbi:MAG: hypothetical protein ACYC6Y_15755 [Thermoguttaceae bacterium]
MNLSPRDLLPALLLLAAAGSPSAGQDYAFAVPELQMHALIQPDASARLIYDISFENLAGAHPIDIVDIGVPHENYSLDHVRASIGGRQLSDFRPSQYVHPGFEVHLGAGTIEPGRSGTLHVEFVMPDMVYQDTTRHDLASFRVTPTWFGSQYVQGLTAIQIAVHLPKEIGRDEILHQGEPFTRVVETADGFSAVWQLEGQRLDGPHMVAISFPKRALARVVQVTRWQLLVRWFSQSREARVVAAIAALILGGAAYFRFTGGTGFVPFLVVAVACALWFYLRPAAHLLALPVLAALVGVNEHFLRKRKSRYLPAIAEVEGGGIKRGLTAPEAAVLLELPVARVVGLVVFGLLKKGALRQVGADPLLVELHEDFRQGAEAAEQKDLARHYRSAARKLGTVVHAYETGFLFLLDNNRGKPVAALNFAAPLRLLVRNTAAKMKAFDLSDTRDYYRSIVQRAVNQAGTVGDLQQIDRQFEWILLDGRSRSVLDSTRYSPSWYRPADHVDARSGPSTAAPPAAAHAGPTAGVGPTAGSTSLRDVTGSFAGWTENTMGAFASSVSPGSLNLAQAKAGFMDLSGIDRVTGEFFEALAESGGKGGGGGGGGGCACAGCACACACAGGGR